MDPQAEIPSPAQLAPSLDWRGSRHWYDCGPPLGTAQGWKLYVSATLRSIHETLERVVPVLADAGSRFKYVRSIDSLRRLNAGTFGHTQIGKCIVVYLELVDEPLVRRLSTALAPMGDSGPRVPFARHLGGDLPMYYRYGAYTDETIRTDDGPRTDRRDGAPVPPGIPDVLDAFVAPRSPNRALQSFLLRYPAFEAVRQQGKFGIFRAFDLNAATFRDVALKVGYRHGQEQADGTDGCDLLRRELRFYRALERRGLTDLAPALIDAFDDGERVALVLEWVEGRTLLAHLLEGTLEPVHLASCWEALERLHAQGLFLGDAKVANFVLGPDGRIRLLDFETSGVAGADAILPIRTFRLGGVSSTSVFTADRSHFLASVLFDYTGSYEPQHRYVDLSAAHGRGDDAVRAWVVERLSRELPSQSA